jgi:thioredoxin-related protein
MAFDLTVRVSRVGSTLNYLNGNQSSVKFLLKHLAIILFLVSAINCWSISLAAGLPVVKDFTVEAGEARKKQIPILVLFMGESCSYCETALNDFLLPIQRDPGYKDKVILRQIVSSSGDMLVDFDGKTTTYSRFSGRHNVSVVPNVMLFDSNGHELASIEGLLTVDFYYGFIVNAIKESLEKIKATEH